MYWAEHKGVFFVEGRPEGARLGPAISTELNKFFSQNHLKTLDDLKDRMTESARQAGFNAVVDFKYGQRSSFVKSIFGMDNVLWFGTGRFANVEGDTLPKR
jgi:hypothetical protein